MTTVFVTGGTGYIGRPLIARLLATGHEVHALVRKGSESRLPPGARRVWGDALDAGTFQRAIPAGATLIHLIGTPHPSPAKAAQFVQVDLASIMASTQAARQAGVIHFVYVSVAQPAPVMAAYIDVRRRGEAAVAAAEIPATVVRPWYVLGPGHRWPLMLVPVYALLRRIPATRDSARRLGLVSLADMVATLANAVADPPVSGVRIIDVAAIRGAACAP